MRNHLKFPPIPIMMILVGLILFGVGCSPEEVKEVARDEEFKAAIVEVLSDPEVKEALKAPIKEALLEIYAEEGIRIGDDQPLQSSQPPPSQLPRFTPTPQARDTVSRATPTPTPRPRDTVAQATSPEINFFSANYDDGDVIRAGTCLYFFWSVDGQVTDLNFSGHFRPFSVLDLRGDGDLEVCPDAGSPTYTLTASGPGGKTEATLSYEVLANQYVLQVGNQHRYEEPWGGDRGDPCEAWNTGNFDDTDPNYRGFNLELLLTNNSTKKVSDEWASQLEFWTDKEEYVTPCYYTYEGMGPPPGATSSVTFFTVVPKSDHVKWVVLYLEDPPLYLCLDRQGDLASCE